MIDINEESLMCELEYCKNLDILWFVGAGVALGIYALIDTGIRKLFKGSKS
jgi:hypothetical protein